MHLKRTFGISFFAAIRYNIEMQMQDAAWIIHNRLVCSLCRNRHTQIRKIWLQSVNSALLAYFCLPTVLSTKFTIFIIPEKSYAIATYITNILLYLSLIFLVLLTIK